jgi:hypothetical protein
VSHQIKPHTSHTNKDRTKGYRRRCPLNVLVIVIHLVVIFARLAAGGGGLAAAEAAITVAGDVTSVLEADAAVDGGAAQVGVAGLEAALAVGLCLSSDGAVADEGKEAQSHEHESASLHPLFLLVFKS